MKAVKGYSTTRWPLPGYKFGFVMRRTNDPKKNEKLGREASPCADECRSDVFIVAGLKN